MLRHYGLQIVVVLPLASQLQPIGAIFIGHADGGTFTPDELELYASIGEVVADALVRVGRAETAFGRHQDASAILAMVTHELRTPLTSIIGFTDLLGKGIFGELPEPVQEPLAHMRRSSQTLLRLVNDILNFSKLEAKSFSIDLAPVDLRAVIHDVTGTTQPQLQERGLELKLEVADDLPPVYANRERLEQVLTNLIVNAIKFTEHGSVTVRASADIERARFSVVDTGIGIAPDKLSSIFEAFQQVDNKYQDRYPGTGLGLAISRQLMELMGGTLTVESTPGQGSTFSADVPLAPVGLREKEQQIVS
jgi:signal transduction histidine kinase